MNTSRTRPGVGLVEVLVVIGVLGLLVGLLLGAVQSARGAAARAGCADRLRQIGVAVANYHDTVGNLPQQTLALPLPGPGKKTTVPLPWTNLLLPHLDQEPLWQTILPAHRIAHGFQNPPHVGLTTVVKAYTCPADGRLGSPVADALGYTAAYGSYLAVVELYFRPAAMSGPRPVRLTDVADGTSQSLLVGERPAPARALAGRWYTISLPDPALPYTTDCYYGSGMNVFRDVPAAPGGRCRGPFRFGPGRVENPCDSHHFWSLHPGGGNFLYVDGSVHFFPYSAADILPALATRASPVSSTL